MIPVPPNPLLGVTFHSAGAFLAANCYAPQKYVRRWSWEIFWMTQAAWCWLLWPIIGAIVTIPNLLQVLADAPKWPMLYCCLLGVAYGIGGTAFNLSIRYIGFALTYAIAVGLSSVLGTLITPLVEGRFGHILSKPGGGWVLTGVAVGTLGIGLCGAAGRFKERDLRQENSGPGEFSWTKGLLLSLVAGVLSAVYGIAINDVARPIVAVAEQLGANHWKGNVAYLFVNPGAFLTAFAYSLFLARRNRSLGELTRLGPDAQRGSLAMNYLLAMLTGTLWYGQFFFYNLGHVRMGSYEFTSWAIHMIMLVLFSNLLGVVFREWKGCRPRTRVAIGLALVVLVTAILLLTYGNYLGSQAATEV
jgi:L-rhamnose-H+ transport protein